MRNLSPWIDLGLAAGFLMSWWWGVSFIGVIAGLIGAAYYTGKATGWVK